jgi:hypothetical protein
MKISFSAEQRRRMKAVVKLVRDKRSEAVASKSEKNRRYAEDGQIPER